ncbi:HAT domain-containing protein [Macrophomina phaseolina MS6]|uniref:HAT domain-containing protein n=1 Tax=Macrophomina phaseolina (strain MS6) TaxID=1126212 RepID=K2RGH8_MACPH|nr:HAT domain-containing protein [Macrophomina phaseolina MS6]
MPENLTEIGVSLGLEPPNKRRRTYAPLKDWKNFPLDPKRHADYSIALDSKRGLASWVHKYGVRVQHTRTGRIMWLCGLCDKDGKVYMTAVDKATTSAASHMETVHKIGKDGSIEPQKTGKSVTELLRRPQAGNLVTRFNATEWRRAYMRWILLDDVSFRGATSPNFRDMFSTVAPIISRFIPQSHNTITAWLGLEYGPAFTAMLAALQSATSVIHISFDVWTSDSKKAYLGIIAHFLDASYTRRNVLLALPRLRGRHNHTRIAEKLLETIKRYELHADDCALLGYFVADGHTVNDAALEALSKQLPAINVKERRLRCTNHICNLGAAAAIYGVDRDCIQDVIEDVEDEERTHAQRTRRRHTAITTSQAKEGNVSEDSETRVQRLQEAMASKVLTELQKLAAWRKTGPIGKLHNIITSIRSSSVQSDFFEAIQRALATHDDVIYKPVSDGGVRWNSTYDMAEVACDKLRIPIDTYCREVSKAPRNASEYNVADDMLSEEEWDEITQLKELLKPFKQTTMRLEGSGSNGAFGSLWESLVCMEAMLSALEDKKKQLSLQPNTHLKACVNLAWKKINTYYKRSDKTPAYRVAVALHPCLRFAWFRKHWKDFQQWQKDAEEATKAMYLNYKRCSADSTPVQPTGRNYSPSGDINALDDICLNLVPDEDSDLSNDEYDRFFNAPPEKDHRKYLHNPLEWWKERADAYPTLSRMAFDLLSCPPTSCDAERVFSAAGDCFSGIRNRLRDDIGEEQMVMKSWLREGLISLYGFGGSEREAA